MPKENPKRPPVVTSWKPGQSGNPGGKPVGARNELSKKVISDILDDWKVNGVDAIQKCRDKSPEIYLRVVTSIIPKEIHADVTHNLVDLLAKLGERPVETEGVEGKPEPVYQ